MAVSPHTVDLLQALVVDLVDGTRDDNANPGLDGTIYRFYAPDGRCGSCWSPRGSTRLDQTVKVLDWIRNLIVLDNGAVRPEAEQDLQRTVKAIIDAP